MRFLKFIAIFSLSVLISCLDPSEPGGLVPKTVDQDQSLPAIEVNNTKLHLEMIGPEDAPVLILLHGGPGNDFLYMTPLGGSYNGYSLADEYRLVFWDQRGTGLSKRHDKEELTLETYLKDLEELVDLVAPNGRQVGFIGHSWGGMYAAMYMSQHPERVAAVVFMEPGEFSTELGEAIPEFGFFDITAEWLNDWTWAKQFLEVGDHEQADYFFTLALFDESLQSQRNNQELPPIFRLGVSVLINISFGILEQEFDFTDRLDEVLPEVQFIVGGETEDLGVEFQNIQRQEFARSRVDVVPGAGHVDIAFSQAGESVSLIKNYLDSVVKERGLW